ncbi:MAG: endopeptidase, partial [Acidobacteriota bacterium]|nr:endopeptidase [Acidobacteriota bacterium]
MRLRSLPVLTFTILLLLVAGPAWTLRPKFQPPQAPTGLHQKEFFRPELYISIRHEALPDVIDRLPNRLAWEQLFQRYGRDFHVYIDPRSGTPSNVIGHIPMIPGTGVGNAVTLEDLSKVLGRPVSVVDEKVVADLIVKFIRDHQDALRIDPQELGSVRAVQVTDYLWQVHITQQIKGIPVRHAHIVATINHGNLILFGTESWGRVSVLPQARISASEALRLGFAYVGGRTSEDRLWKEPTLEVVPVAPLE